MHDGEWIYEQSQPKQAWKEHAAVHCSSFKTFLFEFEMEQAEEDKLSRLPESLIDTEIGEQISNSQVILNTTQDSKDRCEKMFLQPMVFPIQHIFHR